MDSAYFNNNSAEFKDIDVELEEGEDILKCIKQVLVENNISKGQILDFNGFVKDMTLNYIERGSLKSIKVEKPVEVTKGVGEFKIDYSHNNDIFGRVRIVYKDNGKNFDGILAKGLVDKYFKITIRYINYK